MANKMYEETDIQAIANAIRTKTGTTGKMTVAQMAGKIGDIQTGSSSTVRNYSPSAVTPTKSAQTVSIPSGYTGLNSVTVNAIPSQYIQPSGTLNVTSNGTKDVTNYASVNVNVPTSGGGSSSKPTWQSASFTSAKATGESYFSFNVTPSSFGKTTAPDFIRVDFGNISESGMTYKEYVIWDKSQSHSVVGVTSKANACYFEVSGENVKVYPPDSKATSYTVYAMWLS